MTDGTEQDGRDGPHGSDGPRFQYVALDADSPEGRARIEQIAREALPLLPEIEYDFDPDTVAIQFQAGNFTGGLARLGFAGVAKIATQGAAAFIEGGLRELMTAVADSREVLTQAVDQAAWREQLWAFPGSLILGATVGVALALVSENKEDNLPYRRARARAVYSATQAALSKSIQIPTAVARIFMDPVSDQLLAAKAAGHFNPVRARALYTLCKEEMVRLVAGNPYPVPGQMLIRLAETGDPAIDLPGIMGWVMLLANMGADGYDRLLEDMMEQIGSVVDGAPEDDA